MYDMKTSNVGISFDQHDWHYEAKIFMKSFFNFHTVTKNHKHGPFENLEAIDCTIVRC